MPDIKKQISKPSLRDLWKVAKKSAAEAAKIANQVDAFAVLEKGFDEDLGPSLDNWPKLYPDFRKMQAWRTTKIDPVVKSYRKTVKDSGLAEPVRKKLLAALLEVTETLDARTAMVEENLLTDVERGIEESNKKQIAPIMLLKHPDVSRAVTAKLSGPQKKKVVISKMSLEVFVDDPAILEVTAGEDENADWAQKCRDAADFDQVLSDIAAAVGVAIEAYDRTPTQEPAIQRRFTEAVDAAVEAAAKRGADELARLAEVPVKYRWYKIKQGAKMAITIVGVAAAITSLALTPLTFGVSTVAGALSIAKAGVALGKQIALLSESVEDMALQVAGRIQTLAERYEAALLDEEKAKSTRVGLGEMGSTLGNSLLPLDITTIKDTKSQCDQLNSKIDGVEAKCGDKSKELSALLNAQTTARQSLEVFQESAKNVLERDEIRKIEQGFALLEETERGAAELIDEVIKLNSRVQKGRRVHGKLSKAIDVIAKKEPTWALVGESVISVAAGIGFMLAGSVNTPDPYAFAKVADDAAKHIGNIAGSLEQAMNIFDDVSGAITRRQQAALRG